MEGISLVSLPAIVLLASCLVVVITSESTPSIITQIASEASSGNQRNHHLLFELEEAKLKIARLESIFEETVQDINAKSLYLKENEKLIEEMTHEIARLQSALSSLKGESSHMNERLNQLEEEVRFLWATLRKTNFDVHLLESKAQDAENRFSMVTSQVEMMAAIVTEQWIQIQQLDQALHDAEMRALKVKRQASSTKCTFYSFSLDKEFAFSSYVSRALHQLEKILLAAKKYHHELQGFIKQEMEKNEFTAALANKELVFFVASALITFPLMSAWMLLSSQFS